MQIYTPGKKVISMSRQEVRAVDKWAIEEMGVLGVVLMENAGRNAADLILEKIGIMKYLHVAVFCGTGNNGGDGFVVARHLANNGIGVRIILCGEEGKIKGDALANFEIARKMGLTIESIDPAARNAAKAVESIAGSSDMLVDALLGTGLEGKLKPEMARLVDAINAIGKPILAIDIPSGLDCDTGKPLGTAIKATSTVTFVALKRGFENPDARQYTGQVYIASIGVEPKSR